MVTTHLKNISQIGSFPQIGMKIKNYLKPPPRLCLITQIRGGSPFFQDFQALSLTVLLSMHWPGHVWTRLPKHLKNFKPERKRPVQVVITQ